VTAGPNQISRENGKRRVVVQANVRGRDRRWGGRGRPRGIAREVRLPAGEYLEWGGQFENLQSASQRLMLVVPACFALIYPAALRGIGQRARRSSWSSPRVPLALTGGIARAVAARHAILDLGGGRLHRACPASRCSTGS
jgi:cobalt-zinc-cadmium resistance protein CzcA